MFGSKNTFGAALPRVHAKKSQFLPQLRRREALKGLLRRWGSSCASSRLTVTSKRVLEVREAPRAGSGVKNPEI